MKDNRRFIYLFVILLALFPFTYFAKAQLQASTNVSDVYKYIGFDPAATNCGVLMQISDIHMALSVGELFGGNIVTNIDPRLISMLHAISPQPTAMMLTGDMCVAGAYAFGNRDAEPQATDELLLAKAALQQFTNFPLYILPGNHDNPAYEVTNAALFNSVFPNTPRFTNFTVAGLPVVGMDGHGGGWVDPEQHAWLMGVRERLDHNKQVLIAVHQPIIAALSGDARELRREVYWFLKPWTAPAWLACGHNHARDVHRFPVGMTTLTEYVCPAAQNWLNPTANPLSPAACGFYLWCITNGTVKGVVEGVLTNYTYYAIGPDVFNTPLTGLYDGLTNVMFTAEEGHFNRNDYHVHVNGNDVTYWWAYATVYTCQLPIEKYPAATRALFMNAPPSTSFYMGTNTNSWRSVPLEFISAGEVGSAVIPPDLRSGPLFFMASNSIDGLFTGGFGLATTNQMTDFAAWAGVTVGDSTITPMTRFPNAGGISAWDAYLYGLDVSRADTFQEHAGFPSVGALPFVDSGLLRFGGRTNLTYTVLQTSSAGQPWTPVTPTISLTTNGWNEYKVTNSAPAALFRVGANQQ